MTEDLFDPVVLKVADCPPPPVYRDVSNDTLCQTMIRLGPGTGLCSE